MAVKEKEQMVIKLQEQERALNLRFLEVVGEHKLKEYLNKVFRKRVKRVKPTSFLETGKVTVLNLNVFIALNSINLANSFNKQELIVCT